MLKSTEIINFQSHKKSLIEWHPGVNVIVGQSRAGKSSIIRALNWNIRNEPSGDGFVSHWGGDTIVSNIFSDGYVIRERSKAMNGYRLSEKEIYKGFGRAIPEPVKNFLNMSALNFQNQLDPPFMLGWTSGVRGAFLNDITNLNIIDETVSRNKSKISEETKKAAGHISDIEEIERNIVQYADVNEMETDVLMLEDLETRIDSLEDQKDRLEIVLTKIEKSDSRLGQFRSVLEMETDVLRLEKLLAQKEEIGKKVRAMDDILDQISSSESRIKSSKKNIKEAETRFRENMPDTCPLCGV